MRIEQSCGEAECQTTPLSGKQRKAVELSQYASQISNGSPSPISGGQRLSKAPIKRKGVQSERTVIKTQITWEMVRQEVLSD